MNIPLDIPLANAVIPAIAPLSPFLFLIFNIENKEIGGIEKYMYIERGKPLRSKKKGIWGISSIYGLFRGGY